jgi:integrase
MELWLICQTEYFPRNLRLRSSITRLRYFQSLRRLGQFLGRAATLDDFDDDVFACWLSWLVDNRCVKERTANSTVGRLRTLWTFLAKRGKVPRFPTVQKLAEPEITPLAWSHAELRQLFDAAGRMQGRVGPFLASVWWQALLGWLWCTGERIGATLDMEWEHIDLDRGVAVLPPKIRKGRRKQAIYLLWPEVVAMLSVLKQPGGRVFPGYGGTKIGERCLAMYFHDFGKLLKLAGLPQGRKRKSQAMRVSHATWTAFAGGDATRALLHDDPMTTKRHYIDSRMIPQPKVDLFKPWEHTG